MSHFCSPGEQGRVLPGDKGVLSGGQGAVVGRIFINRHCNLFLVSCKRPFGMRTTVKKFLHN